MEYLLFFLLITLSFIINVSVLILALKGINNMLIFHIYTLFEFIFIMAVLSFWQITFRDKQIIISAIVLFSIIWLLMKIFIVNPTGFDNITSSLSSAVIIIVSAYTLLGLLKEEKKLKNQSSIFWITSGFLLYFSGNLVLFALSETVLTSSWVIHDGLALVADLFYAGGLIALRR